MSVEVDLGGQVAVVTGGGGGIGAGVSEALAAAGAHVLVAEIDPDRAEASVEGIRRSGGSAEPIVVDVCDAEGVASLATSALAARGRIDILVNNVGHYPRSQPFVKSDESHWDDLHSINLLHVFRVTRAVLPSMVERGSGSVINVTSVEGLRGYPHDACTARTRRPWRTSPAASRSRSRRAACGSTPSRPT